MEKNDDDDDDNDDDDFINGAILDKAAIKNKMPVLIFYTNLSENISYSKKNWARNDQI